MRPNPMREKLLAGELAFGGWLKIPSTVSAEIMGMAGLDFVCIDLQHGMNDYSDALPMLQVLSSGDSTAVVRVPGNEPGVIGKVLDAGAMAVIVPMVNSRDECEVAVRATKYAPEGMRSYGPIRATVLEGSDYLERANTDVACIPMIETRQAVELLDEILSVVGVEIVFVGPSDLAVDMGYRPSPTGSDEPEFLDALAEIVAACGRHDVVPGIYASARRAADRIGRGFRMISISDDLVSLHRAVASDVAEVRGIGV